MWFATDRGMCQTFTADRQQVLLIADQKTRKARVNRIQRKREGLLDGQIAYEDWKSVGAVAKKHRIADTSKRRLALYAKRGR